MRGFGANPRPDFSAIWVARLIPFRFSGEIGFVKRQGLDDGRVGGENFADLQGDSPVGIKARLDEDQIRAFRLAVIDGIAE